MRILILTQYFSPETGAPQNRLLELAKGFKEKGWEVEVVTAMPNYPKGKIFDGYKGKVKTIQFIDGIKVIRYWLFASNSAKVFPRIFSMLSFTVTSLLSFLSVRKFRPDFFFVESPPLTLAFTGRILSALTGCRLIMNVSDVWPLSAKELGYINKGFLYRQLEKLERYLYKKSYLCSGQSEEIVSHIKKSGGNKVYLFRNGVEVKRFEKPQFDKTFEGNIKIIYAGLLGVAQGIFDIAKNINFKDSGAELHIYGEGAEKNLIINFLKDNPDRNIFLHDSISREEIPDLLPQFYCSLIPLVNNIYGAVPSKIYEAMAAGLPILFSGAGEGAKIVSESNTGLVSAPKDFKGLEKNIVEIKKSIDIRNKMSSNGRKFAEEKFDRQKLIEDFSDELIRLKEKEK